MRFEKTIFLTGFPGFIAERLVERLAGPDVQIFLLVQHAFVQKAAGSVKRIADETGTPAENFALIEGDITLKGLGAAADDLETIRAEVTDVFHLAAVYDLAVDRETAFSVNLEGTRNVNELCGSLSRLERYNYVSTCYVAGNRLGEILETELEHDAGFRNFYEETKYLAEMEVEKLKPELPITIFRPSVVVGDSRTGETSKYDGIYYLIEYLLGAPKIRRFINVGNKDVRLNLVPVDFVVEAMAALSQDERAIGETVALADPRPLLTAELFDVITENLVGKKSVIVPPQQLVQNSLLLNISPPLTGLPHSAVPYFFVSQTYDTSVADRLLEPHGIRCPDFREYAGNLIDFVRKHPSL